jgi:hypothetical protein
MPGGFVISAGVTDTESDPMPTHDGVGGARRLRIRLVLGKPRINPKRDFALAIVPAAVALLGFGGIGFRFFWLRSVSRRRRNVANQEILSNTQLYAFWQLKVTSPQDIPDVHWANIDFEGLRQLGR